MKRLHCTDNYQLEMLLSLSLDKAYIWNYLLVFLKAHISLLLMGLRLKLELSINVFFCLYKTFIIANLPKAQVSLLVMWLSLKNKLKLKFNIEYRKHLQ